VSAKTFAALATGTLWLALWVELGWPGFLTGMMLVAGLAFTGCE